jgi:type II secretory pathway component PulM
MENGRAPFVIAVVAAVLLMQPPNAHAQQRSPVPQQSEQEKAKMQEKAASLKEIDEAYKATIKRIPDVKQSVDPWSTMRTAPQK